ncbi:MAG: LamG-like jellyroll fold domain-containing protein [Planctomycetota bacterium]|nr:LamG-like jellyroll fold domain-containing protein [Planctomycetota bacterium]
MQIRLSSPHGHPFCVALQLALCASLAQAQSLNLPFENSLQGASGQLPLTSAGATYDRGYAERGLVCADALDLTYAAYDTINATEGTIEFWIRPTWSGNDGQNHVFLRWGQSGGGMLFAKDSANNLRGIFNQYGGGGHPEVGIGYNIGSWASNRWHHVAYTWSTSNNAVRMYIDGVQRGSSSIGFILPAISDSMFRVGGDWGGSSANGTLDELRIYPAARTAAEIGADIAADTARHPLLTLDFEHSAADIDGEPPTTNFNLGYTTGVIGDAAAFVSSTDLRYPALNNIRADQGTLEFWVRPNWTGSDTANHAFLGWGGSGGMLFARDGASNLRGIFNRFGPSSIPEMGVASSASEWPSGAWHHLAYTWDSTRLALFVDGSLVNEATPAAPLPAISASVINLGREVFGAPLLGALDQLVIYPFVRTDTQVLQDFLADIRIHSISIADPLPDAYPTWQIWPRVQGHTVIGDLVISPAAVTWESSDSNIILVDGTNVLRVRNPGTVTLTAHFGSHTSARDFTVSAPARAVDEPGVPTITATPAYGFAREIPVLSLRFIPTLDGVNVDESRAGAGGTVTDTIAWIDRIEAETKFMLEEGSRFRGYAEPSRRPGVGYRVVRVVNIFEPLPPDESLDHPTGSPGVSFPDYRALLERFNLENMVYNQGVREVWLWGYHHGNIAPVESNMASPVTGDISNSNRYPDDLPLYNHTYTLYNYNWTRSSAESVHDHGHQFEALFSHAAHVQDGNDDLFWKHFVGQNNDGMFITGRCGWTHMPPNTTDHYDYTNTAVVASDIFDWTPAGGPTRDVSADTWGSLVYDWPLGDPDGLTEHNWYIFWMQAFPGLNNSIPYDLFTGRMTDWWSLVADWDRVMTVAGQSLGLHTALTEPVMVQEPQSQTLCRGGTITLAALAEGGPDLVYRWRANGEWIGDGPTGWGSEISGAFTSTLTLTNAQPQDAAAFDCIAVAITGSVGTAPAFLILCSADFNCDGFLDFTDFDDFVSAFEAGEARSDFNNDGFLDFTDFDDFVVSFEGGC